MLWRRHGFVVKCPSDKCKDGRHDAEMLVAFTKKREIWWLTTSYEIMASFQRFQHFQRWQRSTVTFEDQWWWQTLMTVYALSLSLSIWTSPHLTTSRSMYKDQFVRFLIDSTFALWPYLPHVLSSCLLIRCQHCSLSSYLLLHCCCAYLSASGLSSCSLCPPAAAYSVLLIPGHFGAAAVGAQLTSIECWS